jgi:hypothetical protein
VEGDAPGFVGALKAAKYFTGSEVSYEHFVETHVAAWMARMEAASGV